MVGEKFNTYIEYVQGLLNVHAYRTIHNVIKTPIIDVGNHPIASLELASFRFSYTSVEQQKSPVTGSTA